MILHGENHEEVPIKVKINAQTVTQKRIYYNQSLMNKENFLPYHCSLEVHSIFAESFKGDFSVIYNVSAPVIIFVICIFVIIFHNIGTRPHIISSESTC